MSKEDLNFLEEFAGQGFEGLTSKDYTVPYLKIVQPGASEVTPGSESYIQNAKPGVFYNDLTNAIYGSEINVIPLASPKVWIEYKPKRGGFVAVHEPDSLDVDKSDFSNWKNPVNGNTIVEYYNFYCILPDFLEDGIIIFSVSGSSIPHAKNWISQIGFVKLSNGSQAPFFSSIWNLKISLNSNDKGNWYAIGTSKPKTVTNVKRVDYISKEVCKQVVEGYKLVRELKDKVDYTALDNHTVQTEQELLESRIQ